MGSLVVALALCGAGIALSGQGGPPAPADTAGRSLLQSATPLGDGEVIITLVDTSQQRLAVYMVDAKRGRLRLLAVRDIAADWALTDYNNDPPLPKDVRARLEKQLETGRSAAPAEGLKPQANP